MSTKQTAYRGFGLEITSDQQLAIACGRQVHVYHLHRCKLLQHAARRQSRRQRMQAPRESDVQAIGQEGNEDVCLDAGLKLVKDRPDREIAPCFRRGRLLRFLNASSTATSSR